MLAILFLLITALPVMAQGTKSNSPVQKSSFNESMFYGQKGSIETFAYLTSYSEEKDQYYLYLEKYNFDTDEYYYGSVMIPASDIVFSTTKGTAILNNTVAINKVDFVYDEEADEYYPIETYVGDESVNLTWTFNPRDYSTHKYTDKNIQLDFEQYLQLSKGTYKDYKNVAVTGNIGEIGIEDFDYSGAGVMTGTGFAIIK